VGEDEVVTEDVSDRPDAAGGTAAARQWLIERCHRQRLSPTQRRVAQSYVDTMPDAAFLSTSEAAGRAGVSQATVTRFAASLGFASYGDFRRALRHVVLDRDPAGEAPLDGSADGADPIAEARANLGALTATLDSPEMTAAVGRLAAAHTVAVVGFRASAGLAAYTGFFLGRILDNVRVLDVGDTALDTLTQLRQGHEPGSVAVLVFAMPRYPAATVQTLRHARALGLATVLVIDTALADFASEADHVLVAPVGTGLVFDSHAAPVVLAMALVDGVAGRHPRRTQERLEAHESLVDAWAHQPGSDAE
jgi:DNA-binding MurR/RpiR family transcriptional regulator